MKTAIVHDWLVNYGGAERVVEQLLKLYPDADIFTLVYDRSKMAKHFPPEKVHTSYLQKIPGATKLYTKMLSFMPKAFESFDLTGYDLVIASSSSCAKGVITSPSTPYIAYIHTPMRYAWDFYFDYYKRSGKISRFFMKKWIPQIRLWDYVSSQRIDAIAANSAYISKRIKKFWNRESTVIYPPVDTDRLSPNGKPPEDFYVAFSRFVSYKRLDLAISACGQLNSKLVVIGSGPQEKELRQLAARQAKYHKNCKITFTGRISDEEVKEYLQRCRALIFCAEEDFGIIPVEVQACGRPVIAYAKGGATETVIDGKTGVFFNYPSTDSLLIAMEKFEKLEAEGAFNAEEIAAHARTFSAQRFRNQIAEFIKQVELKKKEQ